jgi:hypothetical protein
LPFAQAVVVDTCTRRLNMPEGVKKPLKKDFDPSDELWDRIVDDIVERGAPCIETVEQLVDESCQMPPQGPKPKPE